MRERWLAAYVCVAAAACFSPSAPIGLPCGEGFTCPSGQTCDIISNECGAASEALIWRDDTAEEFATSGANIDDVTIERQGFVGPVGFLAGGARITGYEGALVPDNSVLYDAIVANTPTGVGLQRDLDIAFQSLAPPGLGLSSGDNVTVTVEGEIELDVAGTWRFRLTANDRGFFELATPGSDQFTRVANDDDVGTIGTFVAPAPGWYRFRGAFQDETNFLDYNVEYDPPNVTGTGFIPIPVDRMRVRATDLEGLIVDGWENGFMMDHKATLVSTASLADLPLTLDPLQLPIGIGGFSMRWNGQFLIDQPGDYTFRIESVHGHRLWIDGASVADEYSAVSATSVTAPITLDPGWHDIVLDLMKEGGTGPGHIKFVVESGPQFAGGAIPADHLRPISGRGARFVTDRNVGLLAIPDGPALPLTPVTRTLTVDLPAGFTPLDVRAAFSIEHPLPSSVELKCDPPNGAEFVVAAFGSMADTDPTPFFHLPRTIGNAQPFWQFTATDNLTDMQIGSITGVMVTMVYDGGVAPFPTTYRYESAIRDLGDAVAFERVAWVLRQAPDPNAVIVRLRTCDTADSCASETFVDVANGGVPDVPVRQFAQYEVVFTSNGDVPTALDTFELRYFARR